MKIRAINDNILCTDGDFGDYVSESGIVVKSNADQSSGITPRWFRIWQCGPEVHEDIRTREGWWVLVSHGRWTEGMKVEDERLPDGEAKIWKVDPEACLALAETKVDALNYNPSTAWN